MRIQFFSFCFVFQKLKKYKIEKNEMGGACGAYGRGERCAQVSGGDLRERDHWGDTDVEGRIILS